MAKNKPSLGILLVHGIGEQERGDTLLEFGEPLIAWLERRGGKTWSVEPHETVLLGASADDGPAYTEIAVRERKGPRRSEWMLAESFWARAFPAPNFFEVATWVVRVAPWLVLHHVRGSKESADGEVATGPWGLGGRWTAVTVRVRQAFIFVLGVFLSPLLQVVMLGLPVLALFPGLGRVVRSLRLMIAGFLGDSQVLVESRVRFDAMVTQVRRDLHWLAARCERVVVVAHSQGAAVAHEMLKDPRVANVAGFVSFGAGIRKLDELRHRRGTAEAQFAMLLRLFALAAIVIAAVFLSEPWLVMGIVGCAGLLLIASGWVGQPSTKAKRTVDPLDRSIDWLDLYASLDPVPNGSLTDAETPASQWVHNRHSAFGDHNSYFENRDEFLSRIVGFLRRVAGGDEALKELAIDDAQLDRTVANRRFRIRPRAYSRFIVWTAPLALVCTAHTWLAANPVTEWVFVAARAALRWLHIEMPGSDPNRLAVGIVMVFASAFAWEWIVVSLVWRGWNKRESDRAITPGGVPRGMRDPGFWVWVGLQVLPMTLFVWLATFACPTSMLRNVAIVVIAVLAGTFVMQLGSEGDRAKRARTTDHSRAGM